MILVLCCLVGEAAIRGGAQPTPRTPCELHTALHTGAPPSSGHQPWWATERVSRRHACGGAGRASAPGRCRAGASRGSGARLATASRLRSCVRRDACGSELSGQGPCGVRGEALHCRVPAWLGSAGGGWRPTRPHGGCLWPPTCGGGCAKPAAVALVATCHHCVKYGQHRHLPGVHRSIAERAAAGARCLVYRKCGRMLHVVLGTMCAVGGCSWEILAALLWGRGACACVPGHGSAAVAAVAGAGVKEVPGLSRGAVHRAAPRRCTCSPCHPAVCRCASQLELLEDVSC